MILNQFIGILLMACKQKSEQMHWWGMGKDPDYRFSLANERTYLAWIRTSLAFLASAVGIDQFISELGSPVIKFIIIILLSGCALLLAALSYWRWVKNEKAMRLEKSLVRNPILPVLSVLATLICGLVISVFIFG